MIGKTLSHYRIVAELGRGGMGVVYRAEDTKLDRTVAIKVLPPAALASEDDRERFYREARAAAALTHPHIAVIHEIDEAVPEGAKDDDLRPFIAMEFIDGPTLEERIKSGPLKISEAVRIASEVADALKAAHAKDIVHRDIKSANIMLDADGRSKVLDFGLAKTAQSTMLTRMGSTLGTVGYMSPEQSRGEDVDARADIWALGVVLYEMISGQRPFAGDYEQAVVYSILNEEVEPLSAVRTGVPFSIENIVEKCLRKEARLRYQTAADVMADLEAVKSDSGSRSRTTIRPSVSPESLPQKEDKRLRKSTSFWITTLVLVAALSVWLGRSIAPAPDSPISSFVISSSEPNDDFFSYGSIAPDGQRIVLSEEDQLWIREISEHERRPLPGTERGYLPFWAPNSRTLGFYRDGSLWKVDVFGGTPTLVAPLPPDGFPFGSAWTETGDIYVTLAQGAGRSTLYSIPERGGQATRVELSDSTMRTGAIFSPIALPGDAGIVANLILGPEINKLIRITGQEAITILESTDFFGGAYDENGFLVMVGDDGIHALPYKPGSEPVQTESILLIRDADSPSVSRDGSLVYMRRDSGPVQFRWVSTDGRALEPVGRARVNQSEPRLTRDGSSYIFTAVPDVRDNPRALSKNPQLFVHHLEQDAESQLTDSDSLFILGSASFSHDGQRIALSADWDIYVTTITGSIPKPLESDPNSLYSPSWTPDGKVVFVRIEGVQGDIWIRDPHPDSTARLLFSSPVFENELELSPDGRFLAYTTVNISDGTGDVLVREFRDLSIPARRLGSGSTPRWSAAGDFLFFVSADSMYRWNVPANLSGTLPRPVALFGLEHLGLANSIFDVTPNGQQFLMAFATVETRDNTILVQNWKKLLQN